MLYEATQGNSKTNEKQGCHSLQLLTDLAHGRRELKAYSCPSVVGGQVKRDFALGNIGLQCDLHVQGKPSAPHQTDQLLEKPQHEIPQAAITV